MRDFLKKQFRGLRLENILIAAGAAAVILLLYVRFNYSAVTWDLGDEYVSLSGPPGSGAPVVILYDDITSAEALDDFMIGEQVSGYASKDALFGRWENDGFGEYTLCIWLKCTDYIKITMSDGSIIVCNAETEAETASLCDTLNEK